MSFTIQNAQDELAGIIGGKTVNKITNINGVARRAAGNVLSQIDPDETRRSATITLYDDVYDYALPMTDLKEKRIVDIRPQTNRSRSDNLSSRLSKEFDRKKVDLDNWFSIEDDKGTKFIRINKKLTPGAVGIDPTDSITDWTASGDASGLAVDSIYSVSDGNSLKVNLAAAGTSGLLTNSSIDTLDLSAGEGSYAFFLWVYLPNSATDITSIKLRVGNSAAKYWEATGTLHFGTQKQGWNLFRFNWPTANTGSPDSSAITYTRIELVYTGTAVNGIRVDKLFASLPRIWEIWYYSKFMFSYNGTWQETVGDASTTLNLDTASFNIFVYEFALEAFGQMKDKEGPVAVNKKLFGDGQDKKGLYDIYRKNNPSQAEKPTQSYYSNLKFKRK